MALGWHSGCRYIRNAAPSPAVCDGNPVDGNPVTVCDRIPVTNLIYFCDAISVTGITSQEMYNEEMIKRVPFNEKTTCDAPHPVTHVCRFSHACEVDFHMH